MVSEISSIFDENLLSFVHVGGWSGLCESIHSKLKIWFERSQQTPIAPIKCNITDKQDPWICSRRNACLRLAHNIFLPPPIQNCVHLGKGCWIQRMLVGNNVCYRAIHWPAANHLQTACYSLLTSTSGHSFHRLHLTIVTVTLQSTDHTANRFNYVSNWSTCFWTGPNWDMYRRSLQTGIICSNVWVVKESD